MEGFTIGRGAPCTVMCENPRTHRPWPKVTTCMSNGQLEEAACYPYDNFRLYLRGNAQD